MKYTIGARYWKWHDRPGEQPSVPYAAHVYESRVAEVSCYNKRLGTWFTTRPRAILKFADDVSDEPFREASNK